MDNCAGTNKSQFCFGALALMTLSGTLDALSLEFMVSGHTKFESDVAAQKTAGAFARADVFNHGLLNATFSPYVTAQAYNADILLLYKDATVTLFNNVVNITKFRQFILIGDDGLFGQDLQQTAPPEAPCSFPDGTAFFTDESIQKALQKLAKRSLLGGVLTDALEAESYSGIGGGTGLYGTAPTESQRPFRVVRLFKRPTENETVWCEQLNYHKPTSRTPATIKEALSKITSFTAASEEARGNHVPYFGAVTCRSGEALFSTIDSES
jgi:hypothetical protein